MKGKILPICLLFALAVAECTPQTARLTHTSPATQTPIPTHTHPAMKTTTPTILQMTPSPKPKVLSTLVYESGSAPVIEHAFDNKTVRGEEPWDMALSPDGKIAYVLGSETDNLFAIDLVTNQIQQALDLWLAKPFSLGPRRARLPSRRMGQNWF